MRPLRLGQETILSWPAGAIDCRVVAAAGAFVLLRPDRSSALGPDLPRGTCSLTFLEGMVPMGWDGDVEYGSVPGELRFRVSDSSSHPDRRSSVRLPVFADVSVTVGGQTHEHQLLDVSAGGMRFSCRDRIALGSTVQVSAALPNGPAFAASAVVRASEPGVAAVEYVALAPETAQAIGAWTVAQLRAALATG